MNVDPKFVVELQGKQFITYDGLLSLAHNMGLLSIKTELVKHDSEITIFRATAKTEGQEFDGYGDATPQNVNSMIAKHRLRMAETRAKARALRDLTNVGMVAVEELGGDETKPETPKKPEKPQPPKPEPKIEPKPDPKAEWRKAKDSLIATVGRLKYTEEFVRAFRLAHFRGTNSIEDLSASEVAKLEELLLKEYEKQEESA